MLRIDRYIMQQFLIGILPALLLLLTLFSFMALAEELEDVGQGSFTLTDALMVVFLTTPKRIVELLPVTALLGLSLIHISEPTRPPSTSRMPSSA